jgi:hypothetical protein
MASAVSTAEPRRLLTRPIAALLLAVFAFGLSLYGSLLSELHLPGSPLNAARNANGAEFARSDAGLAGLLVVAYGLPFVLGIAAVVLGGRATRALEPQPADRVGHFAAVFAVMIGGLAAVVSACMLLAVYGWKHVPAWYTA